MKKTIIAVVMSALMLQAAALAQDSAAEAGKILAPVEIPPEEFPPLTAGITLDINKIDHSEALRTGKSPLLIDATGVESLTLEKVIALVAVRNLVYLKNRWLGRSAYLNFIGSVGGMVPYGLALNKSGNFVISSAVNPDPQQVVLYATQQTQFQVQNYQAALLGTQPPNPPTAPNIQNPNFKSVDREKYTTSTVNFSNGGSALFNMLGSFYKSRATTASVVTSLQDSMAQAVNDYFVLCREVSLLHVANIVVDNADGIVKLNQGLVDSGMGTRLQLLQALTQLAQDRQQLVSQQAQARIAAINLAVTLNLPLSQYLLPNAKPLEKTTLVDPKLPAEKLVAYALRQRPEIVQKRNVVNQQFVQAASVLSPIIPTASYQTQIGRFFPSNDSGATQGIQHTVQIGWQVNNLGTPIFPNLGAGLASTRSAQFDLYNTELQIRAQVRQAFVNSLAAEKNIEIAREAAFQAQEQLRIAEERLKAGIGINIDVIQAQSALTIALQNYVRAIYGYNIQQTTLRRAIGGYTLQAVRQKLRYN